MTKIIFPFSQHLATKLDRILTLGRNFRTQTLKSSTAYLFRDSDLSDLFSVKLISFLLFVSWVITWFWWWQLFHFHMIWLSWNTGDYNGEWNFSFIDLVILSNFLNTIWWALNLFCLLYLLWWSFFFWRQFRPFWEFCL